MQAYQIFTDNVLEISLLNLATGAYRVIKRDARLLDPDLEKEEDFVNYCDRLVNEKIVHEEDADLFLEQTDLEALRSVLYHATAPEFYRYRENVSGQYIWVTTEVLPCRGCCAQNPWATVLVRNDAQADQLSEELDFSYSHDTLTGLANRSRYEADLRELPNSGYESVVCTYIDVVGMHEVNEHLGHRSGDTLLCCLANAARKFFATSRVYRIGSDEFVILTPNEPPYSVWSTADRMRAFLKEKDYVISVGIQQTADLRHLDEAVAKAEAAMRQDRQAYYDHNGRARQLEGLNEKMERTLQEKRDAEHFLKVLAPKYKTVIVVDLQEEKIMYSEKVMDHFQHPRNVGEIENASGVGTVGNAKCGDIMRIFLDIDDETHIIKDCKFKTFGCGAAVATSSMATELVMGKTIEEAMEVTNKAVMEALDGLPPVKIHCSLLAEEAIHAALWDYAEKHHIKIEGLSKPKSDIHEGEEDTEEEY